MFDISLVSFTIQVWPVFMPFSTYKKRIRLSRVCVTQWNFGFLKRTTLESEHSDTRY
ncbi:hypothetical protein GL4_1588 [Methyloceanibacter caenitepidi]|uniref:Uncharacterized protein n=1 Tax=Methyloceanibacter caenitepidi TaxID=1384459 RepID=A0A0A8K255_9HYPH|nr:hypothetical protein GL4_1588 [Methyloceanibacter caenitepidi]